MHPHDPSEPCPERGTSRYLAGRLRMEKSRPPAEAERRRAEVWIPSALLPHLPSSAAPSIGTISGDLLSALYFPPPSSSERERNYWVEL